MDDSAINKERCKWQKLLSSYCLKCVVRYLCCNWKLITGNNTEILNYLQSHYNLDTKWIYGCDITEQGDVDSKKEIENKFNCSMCQACSNILSENFVNGSADAIQNGIKKENHNFDNFQLLITMPLSLLVQEHVIMSVFVQEFGSSIVEKKPLSVKEIFKAMLEPCISKLFNAERKTEAEFEISIIVLNPKVDEVILPCLKQLHPGSFKNPKKKFQFNKQPKPAELKVTTSQVVNAVNHISMNDLLGLTPFLANSSISCHQSVQFKHQTIYLGGRYNKYSRNLPQTPWIIDGIRKMDNCVEEYIGKPMQAAFKASGYNFTSSGREDVDVQMLGNGRPFMIELVNPKIKCLSQSFIKDLANNVNNQTGDVVISKLQLLEKCESKLLKEGEMEKSKSYSALCYFVHPPSSEQLQKLENLHQNSNIELLQKTPIRVLHRRPAATRSRKIFSIKAVPIKSDSRQFQLDLVTQAGTYIKEFVHGDFGRTVPSLESFLDAEVDIINLDVTCVNFNWPPGS